MRKLRIGVIGLGRIGKLHVEHISQGLPHIEVVAVADPNLDTSWASELGIKSHYSDASQLISDASIEAVLICSPVDSHVPLIKACAKQRKHVFCEKPLSLDEDEVKQAIEAIELSNVRCQIGFNRRFDPHFKQLKEDLDEGAIGNPYLIRITSRDPGLPPMSYLESSGGMMMDMTIHDFDMARHLAGSEVEQVHVCGGAFVDASVQDCGDIDTAVVKLKFKNGVLAIIDNCRQAAYGYDQRIEVLGQGGALVAENPLPTSNILRTSQGQTQDSLYPFFLERYQKSYIEELESFYQSIVKNAKPLVDSMDALQALNLAKAANLSLKNQTPIDMTSV